MSLHVDEAERAPTGMISTRELIDPIFMKTLYMGVMTPLLFAYLGSTNALAQYLPQSEWLVTRLAVVWPALPPQYELVLKVRGPGHAASFGLMCAALWTWPAIFAAILLKQHAARRSKILPFSTKEILQFILVVPFVFISLVLDDTRSRTPLNAFYPDQWDFFYLRQWFLFTLPALVLAILIYAIGRRFLNWLHC
jgi:hypothetical protein